MTGREKRAMWKRAVSYLLSVSLLVGLLPTMGRALDISGGAFNPGDSELQVDFDLQYRQPVDITIYVNNGGTEEVFGKLLSGVELSGYDGALPPHDPCAAALDGTEGSAPGASAAPEDETVETPPQVAESSPPLLPEAAPSPAPAEDEETAIPEEPVPQAEAPDAQPGAEPAAAEPPAESEQPELSTQDTVTKGNEMLQMRVSILPKWDPDAPAPFSAVERPEGDRLTGAGIDGDIELYERGEGRFTLIWNGRVNGDPVLGEDRGSDIVDIRLEIQPLGYPELNEPCYTDSDGDLVHGKDYTWTTQFMVDTTLSIDYRIFDSNGDPLFLLVRGSIGDDYIRRMVEAFQNGTLCDFLRMNPSVADSILDTNGGDPVNLIDGNYHSSYTDLRLEGAIPLTFLRLYNSRYGGGSLGRGFTHSYEYSLVDDNGIVHIVLPTGEQLLFPRIRAGKGGGYHALQDSQFTLEDTGSGGYLLTHEEGAALSFSHDGKLQWVKNPSGVTVANMTYTGDELTRIDGVAGSFDLDWRDGRIASVTDSAGRISSYTYDDGLLTGVENPDGDTLDFTYDENGYLSSVRDFEGDEYVQNTYDERGRVVAQTFVTADVPTHMSFAYDDDAHTTAYTDGQGRHWVYHYDEYRNIQYVEDVDGSFRNTYDNFKADSLTDNQGNRTAYTFDASGRVETITAPDGGVTAYTYTADGRVESVTDALGHTQSYVYDGARNLLRYTDQRGNATAYTYNSLGLPLTRTDAMGGVTTYTYNTAGQLLTVTDPENGAAAYEYDGVGRITAYVDPLGSRTEYTYSDAGKLLKTKDALGNETGYTYNANGFTTGTTDALGGVTSTEYGTNGQPLSVTDPNGNVTAYTYDREGLLSAVTDPEGNTTSYFYDNKARLVRTKDPLGNETRYEYDSLDRLTRTTDALGNVTARTYDEMGRAKTVTDANGGVTEYTYDLLGRTVKVTDAMGGETTHTFDPAGNMTSAADAEGVVTSSTYDALNRLATATDGEGGVTAYAYDRAGRVTAVTDALGGVTRYTYDALGNILTQTDALGNVTGFVYDALGRQVEQINADNTRRRTVYDALGRVTGTYDELGGATVYTYDANGNRLAATDPRGSVTAYTYDRNDRPLTVTYADGGVVRYAYNALGLAEAVTDQRGYVTATGYDALGRVSSVTDAVGVVTRYFYDAAGSTVKVTKDGHTVSESEYDALGRVTARKDGLGNAAVYTYNAVGSVLSSTDRNGNATSYTHNRNYAVTTVTNALGGVSRTEYDALGRAVRRIDPSGNATAYTYDAAGNLLTTADALGGTVHSTYDSMGRIAAATDKLGAVTGYTYDAAGRMLSSTNALNHTARWTYDAGGNVLTYTDRNNQTTRYDYDVMGRLIKATNPLNHAENYAYDLSGNRVTATDRNRNATAYAYDGLNRLVSTTDPQGGIREASYNYLGSQSEVTTWGGGNVRSTTRYAYNEAGFLTSETSPLGYETSYKTDKEGNITRKTDRDGKVTVYEYDALYRQVKRTDADGTAEYAFDPVGNLLSAGDDSGAVSFTYDALYRTTAVTNEDGTSTLYTYDPAGNRLSITYPDGKRVATTYDILSQPSAMTDHDGSGILYAHDWEGRVIEERHSDGSRTTYAYNNAGLLDLQKEVRADNTTRREIVYAYDDAGNLKSEQRTGVDFDLRDENVRYYYDSANQLVRTVTEGVTAAYTYDKAGNLLSDGRNTYTYDIQNRLLTQAGADGTVTYEYDKSGNLTRKTASTGVSAYEYSAQNKLVKGANETGETSGYTYNALGARIQNVQVRRNANAGYAHVTLDNASRYLREPFMGALSDGRFSWQRTWETEVGTTVQTDRETVTKDYVVDYLSLANRDIMVYEKGSFTQRNVYGADGERISTELSYADGTRRGEQGENIASDIAANDIEKVWYRASHLDSTLFAVDTDGEVVFHTIYDPWGNPVTDTGTDLNFSGLDNRNNYTGYTWDETLELYFAQARFYDPAAHRFTQEDPVKDGVNWYTYCYNSPIIYLDFYGLMGYSDLNLFGFGLSMNIIPHELAFTTIMLTNGNPWLAGHQLAQVFAYKWLKQSYGFPLVTLEMYMLNSQKRVDVVAQVGSAVSIFEIKHRTAPFYENYEHAQDIATAARQQLSDYYAALSCSLLDGYTLGIGNLAGSTKYKLFGLNNLTFYINLRHNSGGLIEYWFSQEKKKGDKVIETEIYPSRAKDEYFNYSVAQHAQEQTYAVLSGVSTTLMVTTGVVVAGTAIGVTLYAVTPTIAAWMSTATSNISIAIAGAGTAAQQVLYQAGQVITTTYSTAPGVQAFQ